MRLILFMIVAMAMFIGSFNPLALAGEKKIKAAFVLLETIDDQGWTSSHYAGIKQMQEALGDKVEVSYTENVTDNAKAEQVIRAYAEKGYDIIFATTFTHMEACLKAAKEFPDVVFEHCAGYKTNANMGTYFGRMYQAEYLAGYMAGLMGRGNVGAVATIPIPELFRGINAFTIGLLKGLKESNGKVDPEGDNTVLWLNSWRDPVNEAALAEKLAANGHDLIRQMADTPDSAKAACEAHVPAIGYGEDAAKYGAACTLVSTLWNWGGIYTRQVKAVMDGTWKMRQYWGGFKQGDIALSGFNPDVPEKVREKVLAEKAKLERGEDDIFAGPLYDQNGTLRVPEGETPSDQELLAMDWLVKGVNGTLPK